MSATRNQFSPSGGALPKRFAALRTARAAKLLPLLLLLTLPATVQAQFIFTTNNGAITITGYTGAGGAVTIPDMTNGYPVTSIGNQAFALCLNLTSAPSPAALPAWGTLPSIAAPA